MEKIRYKRIGSGGGTLRTLVIRSTLWEGPDHLLLTEIDGYIETYRRYFFRDIQSITIRRDNRWSILTIFFSCLVGACLASFLAFPGGRYFWGVFMGIFALPLLYNVFRGPTCVTHIRTAITYEKVTGLRRVRPTERIVRRIRDFVAQTEPLLTQEQILAGLQSEASNPPPPATPPPLPSAPPPLS